MFCSSCGGANPERASFCRACGVPVASVARSAGDEGPVVGSPARWQVVAGLVGAALLVATVGAVIVSNRSGAASSDPDGAADTDQPVAASVDPPQTGSVLEGAAQIGGVAAVSTTQSDVEFELTLIPVGQVELPAGSLSPGDGVEIVVIGTLVEPAELRLVLPDPPSDEAVPAAWRVNDAGVVEMVTGVWDEDSDELVITTTEFSGWIPDWLDPVAWVAGTIDFVSDAITGRTDPPGCGASAPEWATFTPPVGTGTVHSCFQSNVDSDSGAARAEVFFKSNRRGFQAVTVPAGAAYTWVEGQPDWIRPSLAWLTGAGTSTNVLLPGGMSTSFGFEQPEISTDVGIAVYTTPGTILMDGAMTAVGIAAGADSSDIVAIAVAMNSCALSTYGIDVFQGDLFAEGDVGTAITSLLICGLEVLPGLADPGKAQAAIVSLDNAGLLGAAPPGGRGGQIGSLIDSANKLGSIAERAAAAVAVASAGVDLWDKVLDNAIGNQTAQLSMTGSINGPLAHIELRSGGLGPVDFGSIGQSAIDYVTPLVGAPDSDTKYDFVPLAKPWQSYGSGDYYAYGDDPDNAYRSFVTRYLRETCWRDELCLILGSDTGQEWVFMGWEYYVREYQSGWVSGEDVDESRSELGARTAEGISPGSTLGEIVDLYPGIVVDEVDTELWEVTFPGWERASATFNFFLDEYDEYADGTLATDFDPSITLSSLMAGVQVSINIG